MQKILSIVMLMGLMMFTSCSYLGIGGCDKDKKCCKKSKTCSLKKKDCHEKSKSCSLKYKDCNKGKCKKDKSCCKNSCKSCDGKKSCKKGEHHKCVNSENPKKTARKTVLVSLKRNNLDQYKRVSSFLTPSFLFTNKLNHPIDS